MCALVTGVQTCALPISLQRAATAEAGDRLGLARLDLARFYFAHGLGSEALGVLQVIGADNPRLARDPEVLLMKGASELMLKDYGTAVASLAHPALAGEREALPWQAALAAEAEDWRSEEHTSELQSLMRISYAVFCLKKTNK